jgi:hypothetical protein
MKIRRLLFLAVIFATLEWVRDADPLDTVREAFRASSRFEPNVKVDPNRYTEQSFRIGPKNGDVAPKSFPSLLAPVHHIAAPGDGAARVCCH